MTNPPSANTPPSECPAWVTMVLNTPAHVLGKGWMHDTLFKLAEEYQKGDTAVALRRERDTLTATLDEFREAAQAVYDWAAHAFDADDDDMNLPELRALRDALETK